MRALLSSLLLLPALAAAQFNPVVPVGPIVPVNDCDDGWVEYARRTAQPGRYFSVTPDLCTFVGANNRRFEISPPLPPSLRLSPTTGRITGVPGANSADHRVRYRDNNGYWRTAYPGTVRTVTVRWDSPFGGQASATAPFRYSFVDPTPLRTRYYDPIRFEVGDSPQVRTPNVEGGTPPYRYRLETNLPDGYDFEADGRIVGQPDNPHANCDGGCRQYVRVTDARGRTQRLYALVANLDTYDSVETTCYVMVHGHGPSKETPVQRLAEARRYWTINKGDSFFADLDDGSSGAGRRNENAPAVADTLTADNELIYYVGYDSHRPIESIALEVATGLEDALDSVHFGSNNTYFNTIGGMGCRGADAVVVIAHSMGGMAMDFILGNADFDRAGYREIYQRIADGVDAVVTIQSPHRGSELADAKCDFEFTDLFSPLVLMTWIASGECDDGSWDLQTSEEIRRKAGPLARPVFAVGSHQGMCSDPDTAQAVCFAILPPIVNLACYGVDELLCSNTFYDEQNDGAVEYTSAFACTGENPNDDQVDGFGSSRSDICSNRQKVIDGLFNFDASEENHDTGRNGEHPNALRITNVPDSIWSQLPAEFQLANRRGSTIAAIKQVFGEGGWLHLGIR